jgi:peptidoglycan/xylan/chitin deacetylase (PgdA/CDA1 family)
MPLAVSMRNFAEQLLWLRQHRTLLTMSSLVARLQRHEDVSNTAVITFDDGYSCTYERAWPILLKYDAPATVFLDTARIGNGGLCTTQIRDMAGTQIEFGSHTVTHKPLCTLSSEALRQELKDSLRYLKNIIDTPVAGLAYPFGAYDERVMNEARLAGYQYACSCRHAINNSTANVFELSRIEITAADTLDTFVSKVHGCYARFYRAWEYLTRFRPAFKSPQISQTGQRNQ